MPQVPGERDERMRIGEISQRSAVAPRMLRYYEAQDSSNLDDTPTGTATTPNPI
ncbi:MerR family transcriptional regulator [Arthrobacter ulcerisalmonis]|uniref:hypothetical protein n=1 Tax=Arthrobacter ulcerisalmonis TaxID=2483813 RepID=UPI0036417D3D